MYYDMTQSPILRGRPIPAGASTPLLWTLSGIVLAACNIKVKGGKGGGGDGVDRGPPPSPTPPSPPPPLPELPDPDSLALTYPTVMVSFASPPSEGKTPVILIPVFDSGNITGELHITRTELDAALRKTPASGRLDAMANGEAVTGTWKLGARSENFAGDTGQLATDKPSTTLNWQIVPDITGSPEIAPIRQWIEYEFTPTDTATYSSSTIRFNLRILGEAVNSVRVPIMDTTIGGDTAARNITFAEMTTDATPEASGTLAAIASGGSFSFTEGGDNGGIYGTFAITPVGTWIYDIDPSLIPQGDDASLTETVTVTFTPTAAGYQATTYDLEFTIARPADGEMPGGDAPEGAGVDVSQPDGDSQKIQVDVTPSYDSGSMATELHITRAELGTASPSAEGTFTAARADGTVVEGNYYFVRMAFTDSDGDALTANTPTVTVSPPQNQGGGPGWSVTVGNNYTGGEAIFLKVDYTFIPLNTAAFSSPTISLVFRIDGTRPDVAAADSSSPNIALPFVDDFGDAGDDLPPLDTPTPDSGMI